jgi:undecaprenyl-phosphate 4-deoxy-4-formamido-L-arabinose transferase
MAFDGLVSVVIPVYRSERYLEATVGELVAALDAYRVQFEIVLVNDGSPDRVQGVIDGLAARDPRIHGITVGRNVGQHAATLLGFARSRGNVVVTVDDDGQNPPSAVVAVLESLVEKNLDVVYGRFQAVAQNFARRAASAANRWLSAQTLHNRLGIAISNVRAIRGDLARAMGSSTSAYPYIDALVFRLTREIGEVPVEHRPRGDGGSTYTFRKLVRLWISHLTTLTVLPLKVAVVGSVGASLLGLTLGIAQLTRVLATRRAPPGWLSLFCAVTFLFAVLFAFLAIVSAYLGRMYVSMNERGLVWIRSTTDATPQRSVERARQGAAVGS